jgi:soluble lytic murein transglycosylase-like protein
MSDNILPLLIGVGIYFWSRSAQSKSVTPPAQLTGFWAMPSVQKGLKYKPFFDEAESINGIPNNILAKMGWRESRFDNDVAEGRKTGTAGEQGIMQIVPRFHPGINYTNPRDAILYAGGFLRRNYERFGTWDLAVMAYNWGPTAVANWLKAGKKGTIPAVTQSYIAEVFG